MLFKWSKRMNLNNRITEIKGIGEKNAKLFAKLNIATIGDLISHFPREYEVYPEPCRISELTFEGREAVFARVSSEPKTRRVNGLSITSFLVTDGTGQVRITYFNMPYLGKSIVSGAEYIVYGAVSTKNGTVFMEQPRMLKKTEYEKMYGILQPVYSKTKGLSNDTLKKYIQKALTEAEFPQDFLPEMIKQRHGFLARRETIQIIHNPSNIEEMEKARRRFAYEEFLIFLFSLEQCKNVGNSQKSPYKMQNCRESEKLIQKLPYQLTDSQQKVWQEIKEDLMGGIVMNRLLQGDVGSGKTIIALLALLTCVENGMQGAMMAPTEVLAAQHYETVETMNRLYGLDFRPVLLVGSLTAAGKKKIKEEIAQGKYNLILGTHALIQETVEYHNLGLVITDEQHRFGVKQREAFAKKGERVHTLVMSATPIPRTLAIILYGGISISVIPELPSNRLPIKNCVVNKNFRPKAYEFLQKEVTTGHQAYVICPMIESGVMDELENVLDYTETLRQHLPPEIRIQSLHGKMTSARKNEIMAEYAAGTIDILVSTTVIEVGINVPNATVMMVENAERFGLATLHQIRGRVGRGSSQSYCIFVDIKESRTSKERLGVLNHSNDGFFIANEDLKFRGPGELMGTFQSGAFAFRYADIYKDSAMLLQAAEDVKEILKKDPLLNQDFHIPLKKKILESLENDYIRII